MRKEFVVERRTAERGRGQPLRVHPAAGRPPRRGPAWLRTLRPHQWAKNLLLPVPALAAHVPWSLAPAGRLALGMVAFSLVASAVYVVNDLADLPHDRLHPTKRLRPLAAGELSARAALGLAAGLLVVAGAIASALPARFQLVLVLYFGLTLGYSLALKRFAVLDVLVLAGLYTVRLLAGAALVAVPLSQWFLAFSVFLFLSLALVKRVVELQDKPSGDDSTTPGRGYRAADLPVLVSLGVGSAVASALVYCLYITSEDVRRLYAHSGLLFAGLPILLYWVSRVWLLTNRGEMHEDPVVFALRDPVSYVTLAAFLATVFVAS